MNAKCTYEDGQLTKSRIRSTVVGTGETEFISTECVSLGYSTKDTGLSDNGLDATLGVADVVSKNARPGGQLESALSDRLED